MKNAHQFPGVQGVIFRCLVLTHQQSKFSFYDDVKQTKAIDLDIGEAETM